MADNSSVHACLNWRAREATPERDEVALDINRAYWPGLSAELVRISKPQELAYRFLGHTHYLALHDIVRTDGETKIDGFARSVQSRHPRYPDICAKGCVCRRLEQVQRSAFVGVSYLP